MTAHPAPDPAELRRFLAALRSVESGGRYDAVNATTGARGAYQILPSNWPAWASAYLGDRSAAWSPANQDRVASAKVAALYRWLGRWDRVAAWWLAGGAVATADPASWSDTVRHYVQSVTDRLARYGGQDGPSDPQPAPAVPVVAAPVALPRVALPAGCGSLLAVLGVLAAIAAAGAAGLRPL